MELEVFFIGLGKGLTVKGQRLKANGVITNDTLQILASHPF